MVSLLQSKYLVDIFLYQFFCGDLDWTDSCRHFVVDSGICSLSKQYVNDLGRGLTVVQNSLTIVFVILSMVLFPCRNAKSTLKGRYQIILIRKIALKRTYSPEEYTIHDSQ